MSDLVKKMVLVFASIIFAVTIGTGPAAADPSTSSTMILAEDEDPGKADDLDQSNWDAAYTRCVTGAANRWADDQMKSEGTAARQINDHDPRSNAQRQGQRKEDSEEATEKEREKNRQTDEWKELQQKFINEGVDGRLDYLNRFKCQLDRPTNTIGVAADRFWDGPLGEVVEAMMQGNTDLLKTVMTFWIEVGINSDSTMTFAEGITNIFYPAATALFIISFMVCGTVVAFKRREGLGDGIETAGGFVGKYLVFGGMVPLAVPIALMGTDFAAEQLLDTFLPTEESMDELFESTMLAKDQVNPWVMLLIMLFSSFGSLMQIIALAVRTLVLPLAVGMMPIYAAGVQIPAARASLYKLVAWTVAAVSMPVMAACVYIVAFWIAGDPETAGGEGAMSTLMRVLVLGSAGWAPLAIVALFAAFAGGTGGNRSGALAAAGGGFLGSAMGSVGSALSGGGSGSGGSASNGQMGATGGPSGPGGSPGGANGSTGGPSGPTGTSPSGSSGSGGSSGATVSGSSGSSGGGGQSTPSGSQSSGGGSRASSGGTPSGSRSGGGGGGGAAPALIAASQMAQGARTGVQDLDSAFDDAVGTIPDGGVIRK